MTKDTVETLERKIGYQLSSKSKKKIKELEDRFLSSFWPYIIKAIDKVAIDASSVSKQLESLVCRNKYPVISLDRVYLTNADVYLEVTRITNPKTGEVRIAERPGSKPLQKQINNLKKYKRIVLADAGAFEGRTLLEICGALEGEYIKIQEIYLGFSSNETNRKINKSRKLTTLNLFDLYEWIELRDFFGIDGRNVGILYGTRQFIPYWENLSKWASIPKESEHDVTELCKEYNKILLEALKKERCDIRKIGQIVRYEGGK